ncbi:hypothetical protein [Streptomyces sp. GQFP]|uniref:hypothetical protein n=1 Tax=Streptomyces sp. GQFP TaxID=2907545 RepID=UPI002E218ECC
MYPHRATLLAVQAAGLERLYPDVGDPWQPSALYLATHPHSASTVWGGHMAAMGKAMLTVPDEWVTATVDVSPWLEQKVAAVLAHRTEVERGAAPGLIAGLSAAERERLLFTAVKPCRLEFRRSRGLVWLCGGWLVLAGGEIVSR